MNAPKKLFAIGTGLVFATFAPVQLSPLDGTGLLQVSEACAGGCEYKENYECDQAVDFDYCDPNTSGC